jgi:hypothetical protein
VAASRRKPLLAQSYWDGSVVLERDLPPGEPAEEQLAGREIDARGHLRKRQFDDRP